MKIRIQTLLRKENHHEKDQEDRCKHHGYGGNVHQHWNFNAAYNKTTMTGYTSFAYSVCELYLYSTTGIDCYFRQNTSGSVSADATVGVSVYAKAELLHYNSGTNSASGSITG